LTIWYVCLCRQPRSETDPPTLPPTVNQSINQRMKESKNRTTPLVIENLIVKRRVGGSFVEKKGVFDLLLFGWDGIGWWW